VRVLYLLDKAYGGGGAERLALSVLQRLDPARFDRSICFSRAVGDPQRDMLLDSGIHVILLGRKSRHDFFPWLKLVHIGRRERFDIIHAHKHGSNFWGAVLSKILRTPVFFAHEHSWSYAGDPFRILVDRFLIARRATRMIAVSDTDRDAMIVVEKIEPARIAVLPNGVPPAVAVDTAPLREELGLATGTLVVVCIGARPEKRVDILLRALALLTDVVPTFRLLVVGVSSVEHRLRELASELGVADLVTFLGYRADVPSLLQLADVGVISSEREGSPLAILEYMAAECAIVATRVGGIPNMVDDGEEALLVEPNDPAALARALRRVLDDPELRVRLSRAAHRRQLRDFSLDAVVAKTADLYETCFAAAMISGRTRRSRRPA
jgi:glycosyltransferase involved in cell wall biosynthesis